MARIFISHSSSNNDRAVELRDWLVGNGWDDFFLDLDPERGIVAGEKWKEALKEAANRCEAVLALVSPEWLNRDWCRAELASAELLGKKIFVLLIGSKSSDLASSLKDAQYVDLINDPDAYTRLKEGLKRAGLDPTSFPFEEGRRPYPGFAPLEEEDAAIFFGRDAQIVRGLDKLRGLVRSGVERVLFVLGASGSGKSSFLRAGLLPRLKRDDIAWLPLPTIRPERAVITGKFGLVEALHSLINDARFKDKLDKAIPQSRADIEELVTGRDDGLATILEALRQAGRVATSEDSPQPTIVIAIDQGEELFNEEGRDEDERFIGILARTLDSDRGILVVLTMRTDSFPQVQNHAVLSTLPKDTFTLDRMPEGSYRTVIEGPAALVKPPLKIDPQLTEALLEDASGQDALALLAFTLRHLYDRYQADNALTLEGYEKLGRLKGVIEAAVSEALAEGASKGELPKDKAAQLALVRMAFIPHLARVNEAGQFVRRVATRAEIPAEARPLIDRFADARLLVKDRRGVGGEDDRTGTNGEEPRTEDIEVIEVAHEALLREWGNLNTALKQESQFLIDKAQLERDLVDWQATPEARKRGALLSGNKLNHARDWLVQRPQDLTADERRFIRASADAETARRRWQRTAAAAAFIVIAAAGATAAWQWQSAVEALETAREAENRAVVAAEKAQTALASSLVSASTIEKANDRPVNSAKLALAAWPLSGTSESVRKEVITNLSDAAPRLLERPWLREDAPNIKGAAFSSNGTRFALHKSTEGITLSDVATGQKIGPYEGYPYVAGFAFSPDGNTFVASSQRDNGAVLIDGSAEAGPTQIPSGGGPVTGVAFSPDGALLAIGSVDGKISLWDPRDVSRPKSRFDTDIGGGGELWQLAISPDRRLVVTASRDGDVRFWKASGGAPVADLSEQVRGPAALVFSPDGKLLLTATRDPHPKLRVWDAETHENHFAGVEFPAGGRGAFAFSPDGTELAVGGPDGSINLIELQTDTDADSAQARTLVGHTEEVTSVAFSPDGKRLLSGGSDGTARLWSLADGRELARFDGNAAQVVAVAFQDGGRRIAVGYVEGTARTYDAEADATVVWRRFANDELRYAALSPDGGHAVALAGDSGILVYDRHTGAKTGSVSLPDSFFGTLAVSPGGRLVATSTGEGISIWNSANATGPTKARTPDRWTGGDLVFSSDGTRLATGGGSRGWGFAGVIDVATGNLLLQIERNSSGLVESIAFSTDGSRLLVRSLGDARWYDIPDEPAGEPRELPPETDFSRRDELSLIGLGSAQGLALSPDGNRAVGVDSKGVIQLWDSATGAQIAHFAGTNEQVRQVVFGSTADRLVSISDGGTVGLWNLSAVPSGNALDVVCALLGDDNDLKPALEGYPIRVDQPICAEGYDPPLPEWINKDTDKRADAGDQ